MSTATALRGIGRPLDDQTELGRALDELLDAHGEPTLLGLGEPAHGVAAFPLLRNDILTHLVRRGFRSIALETDIFAAALVDDYVNGASADLDTVLATGFSHGFGAIPANRDLVEWLREYNAGRAPRDRVRFHGFDAPVEFASAPSPREALTAVHDHLPEAMRPESARALDALLGADSDWSDPAAMFDPAASVGDSSRAHLLRRVAEDLASALRRAAPGLYTADPAAYTRAAAHARAAQGLLRYHAAMARGGPDRIAHLLSHRADMMAENLLALVARERHRGPTLVFAHNILLQRQLPADAQPCCSAGAFVDLALGDRYLFLATDAGLAPAPGTLQAALSEATVRRTLFPTPALRDALPPTQSAAEPIVRGHIPLTPTDLARADALVFLTDTDGSQHQYW
ncbi:erythromycin esterase family protein [Nocardia sp. NPDC050406]|uniref:erythromycin esterase family protein n=1 Tax=Nocardia sp. NPDC050406 TaxID=3364318 RepID=UPI0037929077